MRAQCRERIPVTAVVSTTFGRNKSLTQLGGILSLPTKILWLKTFPTFRPVRCRRKKKPARSNPRRKPSASISRRSLQPLRRSNCPRCRPVVRPALALLPWLLLLPPLPLRRQLPRALQRRPWPKSLRHPPPRLRPNVRPRVPLPPSLPRPSAAWMSASPSRQ